VSISVNIIYTVVRRALSCRATIQYYWHTV